MKRTAFIILSFVFILLPALLLSDTSERVLPERPELDMQKTAELIFKYTNEERAKSGRNELNRDQVLDKAALIHTAHMIESGYLGHRGSKYPAPADRVKAACPEKEPECVKKYKETARGAGYFLDCCGENVIESFANNTNGMSFRYMTDEKGRYRVWSGNVKWYKEEDLARDMVSRWMDSPPHRKNILMDKYAVIGIAVKWDGKEKYYGTQVFGPLADENR